MKRFVTLLLLPFLFFSCQKEDEKIIVQQEPLVFSSMPVSIGQEGMDNDSGTKSLISTETEDFVDAYLFAFDASTKNILTYEDGSPVSVYTTSKTFNWILPIGHAFDLWVVCNPGSNNTWKTALANAVLNSTLKESDLYGSNLVFNCSSTEDFRALETSGAGLPMSGMMNNTVIASSTSVLNIRVSRLFAKYSIKVNYEMLEDGYEVTSAYIFASKSNTECPFFYDGDFAQTDPDKLATIDRNSDDDLIMLNGNEYVDLYLLENCQGNKAGATSWDTVEAELGSAVSLCSYIDIGIRYRRNTNDDDPYMEEHSDRLVTYRVYLGKTDMKSNFDVKGNYHKTITLNAGEKIQKGIEFTGDNLYVVEAGETIENIPFECSFTGPEFDVYTENGVMLDRITDFSYPEPVLGVNSTHATDFAYEGTVSITIKSNVSKGMYYIKGRNSSDNLSARTGLRVNRFESPNNIVVEQVWLGPTNEMTVVLYTPERIVSPITVSCHLSSNKYDAEDIDCSFIIPPTYRDGEIAIPVTLVDDDNQYSRIFLQRNWSLIGSCSGEGWDDFNHHLISSPANMEVHLEEYDGEEPIPDEEEEEEEEEG